MMELQNHWFLGIFILWISARTFYHMIKQGVMMRLWFFIVGFALIYYSTEKSNQIATAIFVLLCFAEFHFPYYFYNRIFQQNIWWNSWEDSSMLPANLNYFVGMEFVETQNWIEAEKKFRASLEVDPNFAKSLYWLGVSLGWQEKYTEAIETFEKLVKIKSDYPIVYSALALAKLQNGNIKEASDHYAFAIKLDPWCKQAREVGIRLMTNLMKK